MTQVEYGRATAGRGGWLGNLDWGAILAAVFAGMGVTILLLTIGAAVGLETADDGADAGRLAAGLGTWAVISAILGTLVGTFIGGRFSRWQTPGSATYHGITSWGLSTLLSVWFGTAGALGLLGAALRRRDAAGADADQAAQAADEIAWGGWALALAMLLTLLTAIGGWWLGSRTQVTDAERDTPGGRGSGGEQRRERPDTLTGT